MGHHALVWVPNNVYRISARSLDGSKVGCFELRPRIVLTDTSATEL